ncbi:STM4015 family protein [Streptomyces sp. TP-A0874]|uniref:STM4015 family protein n=1 Tax=Streptomyces sp. TP-A0874 TaxID=549819 RepID=UPI000852C8B6|nr:STM4015 family protein [Streptomyces sp. TP-A0874]
MIINAHVQELYGLPAFDFPKADGRGELPAADAVAWRIAVDSYDDEEEWAEAFERFLGRVDTRQVRALIVGEWTEAFENAAAEAIDAIVAAKDRLPALRSVFLGDMSAEQCEISWIVLGDVTPLLVNFPQLEEFGVRGANLEFPAVRHHGLRSLVVESGGMPAGAVRGIAASDLPALRRLDLWLGTSEYGGDSSVSDLEPFRAGARIPRVEHLALHNSEIQDAIAVAMAEAPVVARLKVLDLSMGVLTDEGGTALLAGQPLTHLEKLDLHHNYLSEEVRSRLVRELEPAGVEVLTDPEDAGTEDDPSWRFVAVGE